MPAVYTAIEIPCPESPGAWLAEDLGAEITSVFGVGIEFFDGGVRFHLPAEQGDTWVTPLEELLSAFKQIPGAEEIGEYRSETVEDPGWAHRWKENFKPFRIGKRILIAPTWEEAEPGEDDILIRIDPAMAFGTGHHATTRLCLEWLEEFSNSNALRDHTTAEASRNAPPSPGGSAWPAAKGQGEGEDALGHLTLLDAGTGTGILAIAAALLGFRHIEAVDVDELSIEAAIENAEINGVAEFMDIRGGSAADVSGTFDVIVANIESGPLLSMAGVLSSRLAPGGSLALSGLLHHQTDSVASAYEELGLVRILRRTGGEWALLTFKKPI